MTPAGMPGGETVHSHHRCANRYSARQSRRAYVLHDHRIDSVCDIGDVPSGRHPQHLAGAEHHYARPVTWGHHGPLNAGPGDGSPVFNQVGRMCPR